MTFWLTGKQIGENKFNNLIESVILPVDKTLTHTDFNTSDGNEDTLCSNKCMVFNTASEF